MNTMKKLWVLLLIMSFPAILHAEQIKDGYGKVSLPDSSVYDGEFKNGLFNGKGTLTWREGSRYEGEFKDGLMQGKGVAIRKGGMRYEGEFKDGMANGKGNMVSKQGVYEGEFKDGYCDGVGIFVYKNGMRYEGTFKDNFPEGKGTITYANGSRYDGDIKGGYPEGKGVFVDAEGSRYEGGIKDGSKNGKGIYVLKDGTRYEGEFSKDMPNGKGIAVCPDGMEQEGEFKDGRIYNGKMVVVSKEGIRQETKVVNGKAADSGQGANAATAVLPEQKPAPQNDPVVETARRNEVAATRPPAESFTESLKKAFENISKDNKSAQGALVIKGLYIGMDIDEACVVVNSLLGSTHVVSAVSQYDGEIFKNAFAPGAENVGYTIVMSKQEMDTFLNGLTFNWFTDMNAWVLADSDKKVCMIGFPSAVVDKIFNSGGLDAERFAKEFMNAYGISEMEPFESGGYPIGWKFVSPNGYEVTISLQREVIIRTVAKSSELKFD